MLRHWGLLFGFGNDFDRLVCRGGFVVGFRFGRFRFGLVFALGGGFMALSMLGAMLWLDHIQVGTVLVGGAETARYGGGEE